MQSLTERLEELIPAGFSGIWINTVEPAEAQREILEMASKSRQVNGARVTWRSHVWDLVRGLRDSPNVASGSAKEPKDLMPAIMGLPPIDRNSFSLVLVHNWHLAIKFPPCLQGTANTITDAKEKGIVVIVLAPTSEIPREVEKLFVLVDHALPNASALQQVARGLDGMKEYVLDATCAKAAAGLTRLEFENAASMSLHQHGVIRPDVIWNIKAQCLDKSRVCQLYRGETRTFTNLRGMDHLRHYARQLLRPGNPVRPKGLLFIGPPGCGKTAGAKAIAVDNDRPLIIGDLPALKGSKVGESEAGIRRFTATADAMAPCAVFCDEIENAIAGGTSDHVGDSGVSSDQIGQLTKWRSESTADVFVIWACNDAKKIMAVKNGALVRDGRFDGIVYFDLPDRETKDALWDLYCQQYAIHESHPDDEGWSPANIEACCQKCVQLECSLADAARYIRPTDPAVIESLREWATGRCLSASSPGLYDRSGLQQRGSRRVTRKSEMN